VAGPLVNALVRGRMMNSGGRLEFFGDHDGFHPQ
jgi:hypothetical protein